MNILVLNGSPRKNGNTAFLCNAFKEGAEEAGHNVEIVQVGTMNIKGCLACEYCHGKGEGDCIQKDDMQELYPKLKEADVVVFASAVHYWGFTAQMQAAICRMYAPGKPAAKQYAMLLSSGSPSVYDGIIYQYKEMLSWFGAEDLGIKTIFGEDNKSERTYAEIKEFGKEFLA